MTRRRVVVGGSAHDCEPWRRRCGGRGSAGGVHAAGIYRALHLSGAIADMERRGVDCVHAFAVDNAVYRVADPVFVGYCLGRDADVGNKVRVCVCTRAVHAPRCPCSGVSVRDGWMGWV